MTGCLRFRSKKTYTVNKGSKNVTKTSRAWDTTGETSGFRPTSYFPTPEPATNINGNAIKPSEQKIATNTPTVNNPPMEQKESHSLPISNKANVINPKASSMVTSEILASPKPGTSILVSTSATSQTSDINTNTSSERRRSSSRVSFSKPEATILNKIEIAEYLEGEGSSEVVEQNSNSNENDTTESNSVVKRNINVIQEVEERNDSLTESTEDVHQIDQPLEQSEAQEVITKVTVHSDQNGYKKDVTVGNEKTATETLTESQTTLEDKKENNIQKVIVANVMDSKQNKQNKPTADMAENEYETERETKFKKNEPSPTQNKKSNVVIVNRETDEIIKYELQNGQIDETISETNKQNMKSVGFIQNVDHKKVKDNNSPRISAISNEQVNTNVIVATQQNEQKRSTAQIVENGYETDREINIEKKYKSEIQNKISNGVVVNSKTNGQIKHELQNGHVDQIVSIVTHTETEEKTTTQNEHSQEGKDNNSPRMSAISYLTNDTPKQSINDGPQRRDGVAPQPLHLDQEKTIKVFPKDPDDEKLIRQAIEQNDFLSRIIRENVMDDIVAAMYNKEIAPKERVIKQGDKGSHMYVSAQGKYQILIKGKVIEEFADVRVFGELAILYNDKRRATIKALTAGRVWVLDQSVYQYIVYTYNIKEQDEIMNLLINNPILNVARQEVLRSVANLLKKEFFQAGEHIVKQGEKGNKFYIIRAGKVTVTKENEGVVRQYKKGDCFGELALLHEDSRQATVTAEAPGVECLTLTRKDFLNNFEELESWEKVKPTYKPQVRNSSVLSITEFDLDINDLKIRATIGVGGFGRVELVQHVKDKNQVFALKYLKKIDIVMQHQEEHVYNEKKVQKSCKSPFIVKLYKTYKDDKYIYFLMEACLGGDLWSLLQKQKNRRFDEKEARFICACVLEAFDHLHSKGIIYRDLKPENLLIDANGYIKLTDFGFAKQMTPRGKTFTFAGTPEYVGPEIVLNRGHDRAVDYWAFGCFVFEMLTGRTPYRTDDSSHMRTYNKILSGIDNVVFPSYVTPKAKHLVEKLCRPIPAERLGMQKGGVKDIKNHRWYLGFEWQKLVNHEIPSPFKPKLKGPTDTSYFDKFKKDNDVPPDEISGWDKNF